MSTSVNIAPSVSIFHYLETLENIVLWQKKYLLKMSDFYVCEDLHMFAGMFSKSSDADLLYVCIPIDLTQSGF